MSTNFAQVNQQTTNILDQNTDHDYESNFIKICINYIVHMYLPFLEVNFEWLLWKLIQLHKLAPVS